MSLKRASPIEYRKLILSFMFTKCHHSSCKNGTETFYLILNGTIIDQIGLFLSLASVRTPKHFNLTVKKKLQKKIAF